MAAMTHVFDNKDGRPAELRSEILHLEALLGEFRTQYCMEYDFIVQCLPVSFNSDLLAVGLELCDGDRLGRFRPPRGKKGRKGSDTKLCVRTPWVYT